MINQNSSKSFLLLVLTFLSTLLPSYAYAETYTTSNGTSTVHVETSGDSDVHIDSNSTTNSVNSIQEGSDESIHVESKNGDTKSQVIINGKKVYEGTSGHIEVKSNNSTTTKNGTTTDNSDSKTTVTTEDGKTTVIVEKNGNTSTIKNNDVSATTNLNVTVDKTNNKLKVKIGDKIQEVNLLPDQALKIVIDDKILDAVDTAKKTVSITTKDGQVIYKVVGTKNTKIFGVFPIKYIRIAEISAENGKVLTFEAPFYTKIFDLLDR